MRKFKQEIIGLIFELAVACVFIAALYLITFL